MIGNDAPIVRRPVRECPPYRPHEAAVDEVAVLPRLLDGITWSLLAKS
jgi:hypothetical protein